MSNDAILSKTLQHESYLFDVNRCEVQLPSGQRVRRDLVEHNGAALILPVTDDGAVVMIRNFRFVHGGYLWELPCGTVENDEDPAVCAARELTEETGYSAQTLQPLGSWWSCPGYCSERIYAYLAMGLTPGRQELEEHEDISVEIIDAGKIRRMIVDNEIEDAKTITALSMYFLRGG